MKVLLIAFVGLIVLPVVGFLLQWICWQVIPTWRDKRNKKKNKKSLKNT